MKKHIMIFVSLIIFSIAIVNSASAEDKKISFSIGLKSHIDKWEVSLNKYTSSIYDIWGIVS